MTKEVKVKKAVVKKVAKAEKKNGLFNENEFRTWVANNIFYLILLNVAAEKWDGQPLEEDRVYHLQKLGGIKIYWIRDNRRTWLRAMKMLDACMKNGMTTPAILVDAKVVADWGLSLIDPTTLQEVKQEELEGAFCVMEGHGRFYAFLIALALAAKTGEAPFDFNFVYKHYETADEFGKAYISTNADMTRTTSKDRLAIAAAKCKEQSIISYLGKIKNDLNIPKAAYFWTFGRELSKEEVTKLIYGNADAPKFDKDTTDALTLCYESFKAQFGIEGGEKIYRGVPAAQWCADQISKAEDKAAVAMTIGERVQNMSKDIYTAILTAKANKKTHITRDQVIKTSLDLMMQSV